ncbi:MAG: polyketide synthase dehydratase domain-containing protein, partial [Bacteroidota bacterium]
MRHSIQESITLASSNAFSLFSIKKGQPEEDTFFRNISKLYCSGYNINWDSIYAEGDYIKTGMYPWQREEHWHESKTALLDRLSSENHPFLRDQFFTSTPTFEAELNSAVFPYLKDHKVMGNIVFPGAGYVESMVAIFKQKHGDQPCAIEDLKFLQILNNDGQYKTLSTSYHESSHEVQVHSRTDAEDSNFVAHAKGKVSSFVIPPATWATNLLSQLNESGKEIDTQEFYKNAKTKGLEYGDEFQVIKKLFKKDALGWAEIESSLEDPYYIPPTVLDGAFQLMIEVMDRTEGLYLPVGIERIDLFKKIPGKCSAIIELVHSDDTQIVGNILLVSPEQQILATIKGVICQKIELGNNKSSIHDLLARPEWVELEQEAIKEEEGKKFLFIHQESNKDPFATKYQIYLHTEANHIVITDSDIDNAEGTAWGVNNGDFTENFAAMINDAKITDVIYFADAIHELTPETDFAAIKSQELIRLQKVTQAIIGVEQTVNLNIVTTGVQRIVSEDIIDPRSAIYWGLNLVYKNEFPKQPLRLIDLPINYSDKD